MLAALSDPVAVAQVGEKRTGRRVGRLWLEFSQPRITCHVTHTKSSTFPTDRNNASFSSRDFIELK